MRVKRRETLPAETPASGHLKQPYTRKNTVICNHSNICARKKNSRKRNKWIMGDMLFIIFEKEVLAQWRMTGLYAKIILTADHKQPNVQDPDCTIFRRS